MGKEDAQDLASLPEASGQQCDCTDSEVVTLQTDISDSLDNPPVSAECVCARHGLTFIPSWGLAFTAWPDGMEGTLWTQRVGELGQHCLTLELLKALNPLLELAFPVSLFPGERGSGKVAQAHQDTKSLWSSQLQLGDGYPFHVPLKCQPQE